MTTTIPSILASGNFGVGQFSSLSESPLLSTGSFGSFGSFFAALLDGSLSESKEGEFLSMLEGLSDTPESDGLMQLTQALNTAFSFSEGMSKEADLEAFNLDISIEEIFTQVRQEISIFQKKGINPTGIANIDELASAYTQLGMDPVAAQEKAVRTSVAIDLLKQKAKPSESSHGSDILSGIFNALTSHEQSQVLQVVSQRTEVQAQRLVTSLNMSQKLSSGDVAMQVLEGKPLLETSTAVERARVLQPIAQEIAALGEQAEFAQKKVDAAVAKAVETIEQKNTFSA